MALSVSSCFVSRIVDSRAVSTRDLHVGVTAENLGRGGLLYAVISGPDGRIALAGGDALVCTVDGISFPLHGHMEADGPAYGAELGDKHGPVVCDLIRPQDRGSPGLGVSMPPPFDLANDASASPDTVTWQPADGGYDMDVSITGDCIVPVDEQLTVDGSFTVPPLEIPRGKTGPCPLTITIARRANAGTPLVPGLEGGSFAGAGIQQRTILIRQ